ncbi:hypothetical protein BGW38_000230, partial [Lunasporangiospora selenospora]
MSSNSIQLWKVRDLAFPETAGPILEGVKSWAAKKQLESGKNHDKNFQDLLFFRECLHKPDFWFERALVERLYYKNKNQHRQARYFKRLGECRRIMARIMEVDINSLMDGLVQRFYGGVRLKSLGKDSQWSTIPYRSGVAFLMNRIVSTIQLLRKLQWALQETYRSFYHLLSMEFFMSLALVSIGICSRLSVISRAWIHELSECYTLLATWIPSFPAIAPPTPDETDYEKDLPKAIEDLVKDELPALPNVLEAGKTLPSSIRDLISNEVDMDLGEVIERRVDLGNVPRASRSSAPSPEELPHEEFERAIKAAVAPRKVVAPVVKAKEPPSEEEMLFSGLKSAVSKQAKRGAEVDLDALFATVMSTQKNQRKKELVAVKKKGASREIGEKNIPEVATPVDTSTPAVRSSTLASTLDEESEQESSPGPKAALQADDGGSSSSAGKPKKKAKPSIIDHLANVAKLVNLQTVFVLCALWIAFNYLHSKMEDQMDVSLERSPPPEEKPPVDAEFHSVEDVEWITTKVMPSMGDLEERACDTFQWEIKDWGTLESRVTGPEFTIGGYKWRILLFPHGGNEKNMVSVYLDTADPRAQEEKHWHVCAQFSLFMSNPHDPRVYSLNVANHRFTAQDADWGFTKFIEIRRLDQPLDVRGVPLMENGHTIITVCVRVYEDPTGVLWHNFRDYDSKEMTGYTGLKNQGATCYMNSLLQSLFFTNYFRKAVFGIPTEDDEPSKSVSLALQRVFYQLATSSVSVGTNELTKSFGWNSLESFMQHDVQEFNRVLQDNLEGKMKGTGAEGAIQNLFVGKMKSYIKCINVDYESSRVENFYDIQLNVKNCKTLRDSFANYVDVETLEGENKYHAEGHGLQDAKKGVIFESLPPVLHLQLKRFEYDIERDCMVKINDRHEFPLNIDLADFVADGEEKQKTGPDGFKYTLHGVLVHSGDLHGGHYFALLKPERNGKWFRFDDDRVTQVTLKEVMDENYGGGDTLENLATMSLAMRQLNRHKRFTNAYMLVYIRDNAMDEVLKPLTTEDIPEHLQRRVDDERAALETRRREHNESQHYFYTRLISDTDFKAHDGFDLFNAQINSVGRIMKVRKEDTFATFRTSVSSEFGVPEDQLRIWTLVKRQNDTIRTDLFIPDSENKSTMESIRNKYGVRSNPELTCFIEVPEKQAKATNGKMSWFQSEPQSVNNTMIFIKYYDPFTSTMEGVGKIFIQRNSKVGDIIGQLNEKKGFPSNTPLKLYEEIKPTMIEPMKLKSTFLQCEIQGGDIIVFQKDLTPKDLTDLQQQNRKATVPQYFEYIHNKIEIEFKPKNIEDTTLETYTIELGKKNPYDMVAQKLAEKLDVDPLHIQFTMAGGINGLPKTPVKRSTNLFLQDMLSSSYNQPGQTLNVLYYEKLDISIVELESKRLFKVTFLGSTLKDETVHELLVLKTSTIGMLQDALLPKITLSPNGSQKLRSFSVFNGKLVKEYGLQEPISTIHEAFTLYVEEVPVEELELKDDEYVLPCVHFMGDPSRLHSVPFWIVVKPEEPFSETKVRLRAKLGMNEKDFAKIKFNLLSTNHVTALNDTTVLAESELAPGDALGLDHVDK